MDEVYKWRPESVMIECECGQRSILTGSTTTCECGINHVSVARIELATRRLEDEALHPWRYAKDREVGEQASSGRLRRKFVGNGGHLEEASRSSRGVLLRHATLRSVLLHYVMAGHNSLGPQTTQHVSSARP
jgi:hypothetical protein